ncbi:helix-turn-helix domain-containing protein [Pseudovibrio sp. Tun.PSC04-5.I4]|uniref:helix-turn-helix domain-containing protein n=1 Tax=Pseudovibrio sp. Tun.PSC04-5.I4 TaxID=1798213 RepID=UPI0008848DAB|nr:helix-turn-helix domain-containing protein [Pseudovibrio sp. Tun.PSC04-5.I4]SDQ29079.1 Helix-turn-helix domain-containing protein [Pseudovibrio sp. Tun.PSC04-5.I4]SDR48941.1 Helix-turn-helix domain-containing protein [Pseudovibrio sp. Tun.PSC04-5.I4]
MTQANKEVIPFTGTAGTKSKKQSSTERIWGKDVCSHGYAGVPSILIRCQQRLGLNPTQMNIILQLLNYWHDPRRKPFPRKKELADRIGVTPKTIQNNIRALEVAGLIRREQQKTAAGDWGSNIYHLDGLVEKVKSFEPEFTKERDERKAKKEELETPKGKRKSS